MKRIITCSDGTWNLPGDTSNGQIIRTNVQKIFEAICNEDSSGIHQIKYYDEGIGAEGSRMRRVFDGMTGGGLDQNILDIYKFICWNYSQGDEIYLFGFSRGAYTARSLAGLIRTSGLVRNNDLLLINEAYEIYRDRSNAAKHPNGDVAKEFRAKYSQPDLRIKFIGVWDTVGSLGIPIPLLMNKQRYQFHDTTLSSQVDYAYQALALDERRKNFEPTMWQQSESVLKEDINQVFEQAWFPGVHSNIGGGYPTEGLSDAALQWMIDKARTSGLSFEEEYVTGCVKPKADDQLYDSSKSFPYSLLPKTLRPVMLSAYANERIHPSVFQRMELVKGYLPRNIRAEMNNFS